jgi:putative hemolysin
MDSLSLIIVLIVLFLFAALFACSETSLFSLSKGTLHKFLHSDRKSERRVSYAMRTPERILITILTGNLLVHILISQLSTRLFLSFSQGFGHIIAIAVITPLLILLGEITPKIIAMGNPEYYARRIIYPLSAFNGLFLPVKYFFSLMTRPFAGSVAALLPERERETVTSEEIELEIDLKEEKGLLSPDEAEFILNVVRFSEKRAWNILVPRNQAVFIPDTATVNKALSIFRETGVVRAPVYCGSSDTITGVLDSRELLFHAQGLKKDVPIKKYVHSIPFYPASIKIGPLLEIFLRTKIQIAVAVDEYGGTAGVVTLSAIITELMGKEFVLSDADEKKEIRVLEGGIFVIPGEMQLSDFNAHFDEEITAEDSDTVGGYIIEELGHIPSRNAILFTSKHKLRVRSVRRNRIESVEISKEEPLE